MIRKFIEKLQTPVRDDQHYDRSKLLQAVEVGKQLERAIYN